MRILTLLFLLLSGAVFAQKQDRFPAESLQITWELVTNQYEKPGQHLARFTLLNTHAKMALPAKGWTIYYNGNRDVTGVLPGSGLETGRIHGDLFRLAPGPDFKGLAPGKSLVADCVGDAWVFNVSDAPSGYYLVWEDAPTVAHALPQVSAKPPATLADFKRSADGPEDQLTPERVFAQNAKIADIPAQQLPLVFPTPATYIAKPGLFMLDGLSAIAAEPEFQQEAVYLSGEFRMFLGRALPLDPGNPKSIRLRKDASLPDEAYRLEINTDHVNIVAAGSKGIFYGIQSLKQMVPLEAWASPVSIITIPCAEVRDQPRFGYRGVHMDVARNFQRKEQVLRMLNWMAMYKLNTLHFHFSDDEAWRIEIPGLPELTSLGATRGHTLDSKEHLPATYGSGGDVRNPQSGYYTREDYLDILRHAKKLHIEVIPEIETPGHARAAIKSMEARYRRLMAAGRTSEAQEYRLADPEDHSKYLTAQYYTDNVMCVALPSVYRFLETTVDALMSMHREAGMPLKTIHMGGDEVPVGVWEQSPACQALLQKLPRNEYRTISDLWQYYWKNVQEILQKRGLFVSGWEEIGMRETKLDGQRKMMVNPGFANAHFRTYVWNTVIGWGSEDLPYRLANGGYEVVLCPVSNLYFDLAYEKDFAEPGYYWGGFVDVDKPFYFIPFDYLKNTKVDRFGNPVSPEVLMGKDRLTDYGKSNIVGIQGHLWSENIRTPEMLEYLAFPKILGLAERAWAQDPDWAREKDPEKAEQLYQKAWNVFVNLLGKRELPRLAIYQGGARFRIPTVGARVVEGKVEANVMFPGLDIRYTTDGTEPALTSMKYQGPLEQKGRVKFRAFDQKGRGGRTIEVEN
ncbi:MAG: carbohydate-binding domain-containing protein [Chitinophagales bacterium]|nr:carbohydate-binding domain-containing protein [Chitinophagales bacterium]